MDGGGRRRNGRDGATRVHGVDYTKTTALPDAGWVVIVYRELRFGPDVSFESVRKATPAAVAATVRNGDETRTCRYAVYVGDTYQQPD